MESLRTPFFDMSDDDEDGSDIMPVMSSDEEEEDVGDLILTQVVRGPCWFSVLALLPSFFGRTNRPSSPPHHTTTPHQVGQMHEKQAVTGGTALAVPGSPKAKVSAMDQREHALLDKRWATRAEAVTDIKLFMTAQGKQGIIDPHTKGGSNFMIVCNTRLTEKLEIGINGKAATKMCRRVDPAVSCKFQVPVAKSKGKSNMVKPWAVQQRNTELIHLNCVGVPHVSTREVVQMDVFQKVVNANRKASMKDMDRGRSASGREATVQLEAVFCPRRRSANRVCRQATTRAHAQTSSGASKVLQWRHRCRLTVISSDHCTYTADRASGNARSDLFYPPYTPFWGRLSEATPL